MRITVQHHEVPTTRRRQPCPDPTITDYLTDREPADYAALGEPVTDWTHQGTTKQRQFCKRHRRLDHLFVVTVTT